MNCEVICDLLPLYIDKLTSPKTNQLIEEHLAFCPECSAYLKDLRMPIESPHQEGDGDKLIKALHRHKRRNRAITVSICILVPLVILLAWWIHMETHFKAYSSKTVSTDPAVILEEEPQVEVTGDEIELSRILFTLPVVTETFKALPSDTGSPEFTQLSPSLFDEFLTEYLPEGARVSELLLFYNLIVLDYHCNGTRIILSIGDGDGTGHVDTIHKTVATPDENHKVEYVYTSIYDVATKKSEYEKAASCRKWFGFLSE